jgi:hypothetical protein
MPLCLCTYNSLSTTQSLLSMPLCLCTYKSLSIKAVKRKTWACHSKPLNEHSLAVDWSRISAQRIANFSYTCTTFRISCRDLVHVQRCWYHVAETKVSICGLMKCHCASTSLESCPCHCASESSCQCFTCRTVYLAMLQWSHRRVCAF